MNKYYYQHIYMSELNPNGIIFVTGLSRPTGLAFDNSGNLYCANYNSNSISKITPAGIVSVFVN